MAKLLLEGIRVVESSMLLNGASTTMMLADLGAEVIKVESPFLGDYIRAPDTAHMHRQVNRAKRSIALDLRRSEGQVILARLIATADIFVTNAVGARNGKLGLDYESLRAIKPDIIYCQNTGFGATGPWSEVPTHGQMMDAIAGAMPVDMDEDGLTIASPRYARRTGSLVSAGEGTAAGAIYSAFHIAAALAYRDRTGDGCYLDTSSAAAVIASGWTAAAAMLNVPGRTGWWQDEANTRPIARYQSYRTADGRFILLCPEERKFWQGFCEAVDRPDLIERERGIALRHELQAIVGAHDLAYWMDMAVTHRLPIGPVHDGVEAVRSDPQMTAREIFGTDEEGHVIVRQPVLVDGAASPLGTPAPDLGQDTDVLLAELGYDGAEICALREKGVTHASARDEGHISRAIFGNATD
jgi:formyl-CoA transferase